MFFSVDQFDSGQNLPKKKKGFKITRVTEVDGDDSADELEDPSGDVSSINITQDVHSLIFGDESALPSNTYSLTEATSEKSQNTQQNYFTTNSTFVSVPQVAYGLYYKISLFCIFILDLLDSDININHICF